MDRCCNWPLILLMWHSDFLQFDVHVTCQLRLHGQYHQNVANYYWNTLHLPNSSNNNNTLLISGTLTKKLAVISQR